MKAKTFLDLKDFSSDFAIWHLGLYQLFDVEILGFSYIFLESSQKNSLFKFRDFFFGLASVTFHFYIRDLGALIYCQGLLWLCANLFLAVLALAHSFLSQESAMGSPDLCLQLQLSIVCDLARSQHNRQTVI